MSTDRDNRSDDTACGKLWEIYVKEAQEYDEGMIKSWKEDMDNILVFSGLYSAILTAFVIESYQNLQPDSSEDSSALLRRISEQLASSTTLSPIPIDPSSFTPTTAALACNILWFISLALALTCSFLATLVQQWCRRFLHRTSTVRSPGAHAHLLQFLYFGLKDLRMHGIVDLIPSLLHLSLFSFFAGLIGFLHDVNGILTWISTASLTLVLLIYLVLTALPLFRLDSPYATPLSSALWGLLQIGKHIRFLTPTPPISSLIRRIRSLRPPYTHFHESDEEAQRVSFDARYLASIQEKPPVLEWSIVDATTKVSRIRHIERESKSIVWLLKSLNDDFELLPFVEALPEALQHEEVSAEFRQSNLHLLEALVASIEPQGNIILRILNLMENALNPEHTKVYRERCATACARALYTVGHVVQANPEQFRSMAYDCPLFTNTIIDRIGQGLSNGALDMAYGQSAFAMCAFSSCQWARDRLTSEGDVPSRLSSILKEVAAIGRFKWRDNRFITGRVDPGDKQTLHLDSIYDLTQSQSFVDGVIGYLVYQYAEQAIEIYPQHFEYLSQVFIGIDPRYLKGRSRFENLFWHLAAAFDSHRFTLSDRDKADGILGVAIQVTASRDHFTPSTPDLHNAIPACISSYHHTFGWGCRSVLDRLDVRRNLFKCLQLRRNYQPSLDEEYLTCLKHLLATGYIFCGEESGYLFWAGVYGDIHQFLTHGSPQALSLAYLIALKAAQFNGRGFMKPSETLLSLLDQIYENVSAEGVYHGANRGHLHWITLLQCLGSSLPISHISDILKFFHSRMWRPPTFFGLPYAIEVENNVSFVTLFTRRSEEYLFKLVSCVEPELEQILAINGMIWRIWYGLADGLYNTATLEECRAWNGVFSLLKKVDEALTLEMRQISQAIAKQPRSPANPSSTILHPDNNTGIDNRQFLNLPVIIEDIKRCFSLHAHLFTTIPEADAEEDHLLSMDDGTYSNHIHHDRLSAHYFTPLPPSHYKEEDALRPPPEDTTYDHVEPAVVESYAWSTMDWESV